MAFAVRETQIANPGRVARRKRKNMAKRHLSAKQIRAGFGGKRRRTALKAKRHNPRSAPKRKTARKTNRAATRRAPARKRNMGEVVSILLPGMAGNPARRKGKKTMAAHKRKTKRASVQRNAGTRRRTTKKMYFAKRRHSRRNPGGGQVFEYVKAGAAVVGGAVGSKLATQAVLGASNTSWMGYGGNLVATGLLGWGSHLAFKNKLITQMVIAGGIAQVIVRMIGDFTPYGQYLSGAGVGDYQASAFLTPQRMMPNAMRSAALEQPKWSLAPPPVVAVTHSATAAGVGFVPDWN
jgi:hypothetical protein